MLSLCLFVCVQTLNSLQWSDSIPMPEALTAAAIGSDKNYETVFIFPESTNYSYIFDGTKYIKSMNKDNVWNCGNLQTTTNQRSTTIDEMIYQICEGYIPPFIMFYNTTIEQYSKFEIKIPMETDDYLHGACITSNITHLFIFGGNYASDFFDYNLLRIYDISKRTWPLVSRTNQPYLQVGWASCGYYNNVVYMFGGQYCEPGCHHAWFSDSIVKYDTIKGIWTYSNATLTANKTSTWAINDDGIFYIIGGLNENTTNSVDLYFVNNDTVKSDTSLIS
eukprot:301270_1